ncbi:hypothetical protein YC2023_124074 [Brassica napus]
MRSSGLMVLMRSKEVSYGCRAMVIGKLISLCKVIGKLIKSIKIISRFEDIIEVIHIGGSDGNEQTLYATMELNSPAMIPGILTEGVYGTKYTINGKHVWARKFIPSHKSYNNNLLSHSYGNLF